MEITANLNFYNKIIEFDDIKLIEEDNGNIILSHLILFPSSNLKILPLKR